MMVIAVFSHMFLKQNYELGVLSTEYKDKISKTILSTLMFMHCS